MAYKNPFDDLLSTPPPAAQVQQPQDPFSTLLTTTRQAPVTTLPASQTSQLSPPPSNDTNDPQVLSTQTSAIFHSQLMKQILLGAVGATAADASRVAGATIGQL